MAHRQDERIRVIAGGIASQRRVWARQGEALERETIEGWNRRGWTFELRYADGDYISDNDFTRIEGLVLSDQDLDRAIQLSADL